jgi:hypothetical protein
MRAMMTRFGPCVACSVNHESTQAAAWKVTARQAVYVCIYFCEIGQLPFGHHLLAGKCNRQINIIGSKNK